MSADPIDNIRRICQEQPADALDQIARELGYASHQGVALPAGWVLVPVEPTLEMQATADEDHGVTLSDPRAYAVALYAAMLAAAPQPPAVKDAAPAPASKQGFIYTYPPAPATLSDEQQRQVKKCLEGGIQMGWISGTAAFEIGAALAARREG